MSPDVKIGPRQKVPFKPVWAESLVTNVPTKDSRPKSRDSASGFVHGALMIIAVVTKFSELSDVAVRLQQEIAASPADMGMLVIAPSVQLSERDREQLARMDIATAAGRSEDRSALVDQAKDIVRDAEREIELGVEHHRRFMQRYSGASRPEDLGL